jgi:DNA-binding CsgD family transcriptional regulator
MAQARLPLAGSSKLSALEAKCLTLYGSGWSRDEISRLTRTSRRSVGTALTVAKEKLGARTLAHAALLLGLEISRTIA